MTDITLKLNADPYILSALREDVTSEDVTTNAIMPKSQPGQVDLIAKEEIRLGHFHHHHHAEEEE